MTKTFILYEHALGYALFKVKAKSVEAVRELADNLLHDEDNFVEAFKLHAFVPFSSSASALQNCNGISESVVPSELKQFLTEKLPSCELLLCVADRKLAEAIKAPESELPESITYSSESILHEVYRALRLHFQKYATKFSHFDESKAQIGLGHSYSRAKVKFNINRNDNMIIQSINLLDQLDKDVNNFCMRVREWFSYHFPELSKLVPDNGTYIKVINLIRTRDGAVEENREAIEQLTNEEVAGFDITDDDAENLVTFTEKINTLIVRRKLTHEYLTKKLAGVAPNLHALIGEKVSARLIAHAGSLMNLAKFPASTIQILGAEKALFRALKSRGNTPKYGLIYHSPFITRASRENKGRISRFLAAKCAIACRIDCFSDILCDVYGKHLKQQIEDRLNYFDSGVRPQTNAQAMATAVIEANKYIRKAKKRAIKTLNQRDSDNENLLFEVTPKKKNHIAVDTELYEENHVSFQLDNPESENEIPVKKKKKIRHNSESVKDSSFDENKIDTDRVRKRTVSESSVTDQINGITPTKKKKKHIV